MLKRDLQAILLGLGDDVDDARDRIRSVDRGSAVLQHLDALDGGLRDRVEIHRAGHTRRRRGVHEAHRVDHHQRALGLEVAQIDLGGAGTDAAAILRIAEIARAVVLGIEAAAGTRQALQHVGDRGKARLVDIRLVHERDRRGLIESVVADARSGDDDLVVRGGGRRPAGATDRCLRGLRDDRLGKRAGERRGCDGTAVKPLSHIMTPLYAGARHLGAGSKRLLPKHPCNLMVTGAKSCFKSVTESLVAGKPRSGAGRPRRDFAIDRLDTPQSAFIKSTWPRYRHQRKSRSALNGHGMIMTWRLSGDCSTPRPLS